MVDRLSVGDEDLSDLIDGRLNPAREHEVRRALEEQPALARRYARLIEQDRMLRRLGEEVLSEPVPESMINLLRGAQADQERRARLGEESGPVRRTTPDEGTRQDRRLRPSKRLLVVSSALAVAAGLALGWLGHAAFGNSDAGLFQDAVHQAAISHRLFEASGTAEPLVDIGDGDVLPVAGLPRLFGTPVRAPVLGGSKWVPVGLKTETGSSGNAMQIAYADSEGDAVTLFIRPLSEVDDVPASLVEAEGYDVLYWVDGPLIYALVGDQEEATLVDLARRIYASRATGGDWSPNARPATAQPATSEDP